MKPYLQTAIDHLRAKANAHHDAAERLRDVPGAGTTFNGERSRHWSQSATLANVAHALALEQKQQCTDWVGTPPAPPRNRTGGVSATAAANLVASGITPETAMEAEWREAYRRADATLRELIVTRDKLIEELAEVREFARRDEERLMSQRGELAERLHAAVRERDDAVRELVTVRKSAAETMKELDQVRASRVIESTRADDAMADRKMWRDQARRAEQERAEMQKERDPREWQPGDVLRYNDAVLGDFIVRYENAVDGDECNFNGVVVNPGKSGWVKGSEYLFARGCFELVPSDQVAKPVAARNSTDWQPDAPNCSCNGQPGHLLLRDVAEPGTEKWRCSCGRRWRVQGATVTPLC